MHQVPPMHLCPRRGIMVNLNDPKRHLSSRIRKVRPSLTLAITALAARMAKGELEQKIEVPEASPLAPLATALDDMRQRGVELVRTA